MSGAVERLDGPVSAALLSEGYVVNGELRLKWDSDVLRRVYRLALAADPALAEAIELGLAWHEAEAALPEGWRIYGVRATSGGAKQSGPGWQAQAGPWDAKTWRWGELVSSFAQEQPPPFATSPPNSEATPMPSSRVAILLATLTLASLAALLYLLRNMSDPEGFGRLPNVEPDETERMAA